ncbi:transcription antitermination factor NusB [Radicibacter daui]|uniref:transcription antitermination factor NusB n=1 Tax=Radicibacter daui TaxID=3064829 RepID=UPI004046DD07
MADAKEPKTQKPSAKARRTAARLAAVQALYQLEANPDLNAEEVLGEFLTFRLGHEVDGEKYVAADPELLGKILRTFEARGKDVLAILTGALDARYPLDRLEALMRCTLEAGVTEMLAAPDTESGVIINDYVNVAHGFFEEREPKMVNAILDKIAKGLKS